MNLSDHISAPENVITEALRSVKNPNVDTLTTACVKAAGKLFVEGLAAEVLGLVNDEYDGFVMINGGRDDMLIEQSEWDSGMDDAAERITEPYSALLSADWLGKNTVDARWHEDGQREKWCASLAREVLKQKTASLKPNQVLSSAGVTAPMIEAAASAGASAPGATYDPLPGVVEAMQAIVTSGTNLMLAEADLLDELDIATDTDDGLALGAMKRLVPDADADAVAYYVQELRGGRRTWEGGVTALKTILDALADDLTCYDEAVAASKAQAGSFASAPAEEAKADKPKRQRKKAEAAEAVVLPADTVARIKSAIPLNDKDLGDKLGVSRTTLNNWASGKTEAKLTDDQRNAIVATLEEYRDAIDTLLLEV